MRAAIFRSSVLTAAVLAAVSCAPWTSDNTEDGEDGQEFAETPPELVDEATPPPVADAAPTLSADAGSVGGYNQALPLLREVDDAMPPPPPVYGDGDDYDDVDPGPVRQVAEFPVSTFSSDVDTAAYANVRRYLNDGQLPPRDAVRIEELVNYFDYDYALPEDADAPFVASVAVAPTPWNADTQLLHIGIQGYDIEPVERPRANLVFLLDVSGSMQGPDRLPLLQQSMRMLVDQLDDDDTVGIVTYASGTHVVLEPTSDRNTILRAIDGLTAGGSTAGASGIDLAYELASRHLDEDAVNRVILGTDGDFNVGVSNPDLLEDTIAQQRETGIYLSILGFGRGNLNDQLMQRLAQAGNGNAAYIDGLLEARRVLVDEMSSTLFPIADDLKLQVEFNPAVIAEYRLIGYETRALNREDFNNDEVDAGDIGAGHSVTALYEITPVGSPALLVDDLRYGTEEAAVVEDGDHSDEYAFLRIRYKPPGEDESLLIERPITVADVYDEISDAPTPTRFATAVAAFAQLLRGDPYLGDYGFDDVYALAEDARGEDPFGFRAEFLQLVRVADVAGPQVSER